MCSIPIISELTAPYELLSWKSKIEWPLHSTYDHDILPIQNRHFLPTMTFYLYRTDIFFLPRHSTYTEQTFSSYHDILPIQNRLFLPTTTFYLYRTDIFFLPRHSTYTEQTFSSYHDILPIQNRHFLPTTTFYLYRRHFLPIWCAWLLETPSYQWFQSYHGKNKLLLMKWWWFLFFLDDELSFYSDRSWK